MATYRVEDLTGALLDAAIAKAEGVRYMIDDLDICYTRRGMPAEWRCWSPQRFWEQGGPIIERERILLNSFACGDWAALSLAVDAYKLPRLEARGPTPLIAAMRAFVRSKLGEEIKL